MGKVVDWLLACGQYEDYSYAYSKVFDGSPLALAFMSVVLIGCIAVMVSPKIRKMLF